jgi:hypothetical protein
MDARDTSGTPIASRMFHLSLPAPSNPLVILMLTANYNYSTGKIRAALAPEAQPAEVHAGPEGRLIVLHLTLAESVHLLDQLRRAVHWAERSRRPKVWPN